MKADHPESCSVDSALRIIEGRWKPALVWHLLNGSKRYGELRRLIRGISERMLARQLQQLERDGIVHRTVYPDVPPRVDYALTERGRSLAAILEQLAVWAEQHAPSMRPAVVEVASGTVSD
jgi:DNA-binding HxlR family transcriptional regulator